jgi:hypothetical protein
LRTRSRRASIGIAACPSAQADIPATLGESPRVHRDAFVELSFERDVGSATERPLAEALTRGAWHGTWTITLGSLPAGIAYVLRYGWMDLPWPGLTAQLGTFIAVAGALYGGGIALGEAFGERARRGPRALSVIALPALGGAIAGLLPGAFAAERFGRIPAPYFGTLEILIVGVLAFFLLGATLLHARAVPARRAVPALGLALLVPLGCALTVAAIVPSTGWAIDALVLTLADRAPSLGFFGAAFAALVGALFGALLGFARLVATRRTFRLSGAARSRGSA